MTLTEGIKNHIIMSILSDPGRTNRDIAKELNCNENSITLYRTELENHNYRLVNQKLLESFLEMYPKFKSNMDTKIKDLINAGKTNVEYKVIRAYDNHARLQKHFKQISRVVQRLKILDNQEFKDSLYDPLEQY